MQTFRCFPKRLKCPARIRSKTPTPHGTPWSSTDSRNSASQADYSTGRAASGFNAKKDLLAQLLALNQQVAAKIEEGEPAAMPGVPKNYPAAMKLVAQDCVKPTEPDGSGK